MFMTRRRQRPDTQTQLVEKPDSGLRPWLMLGTHAAVFTLVMVLYPRLQNARPDLFDTNDARLLVPAWMLLLALHLLLAYAADLRYLRKRARAERIRHRLHHPAAPPATARYMPPPVTNTPLDSGEDASRDITTFERLPAPTSPQTRRKRR